MEKVFVCKRMRLCNYLTSQGFTAYGTQPDKTDPHYSNWLFEVTPELTAAIARWFNEDCYTARLKRRLYAEEKISDRYGR